MDPAKAVREWLVSHPLPDADDIVVVAFGKASAAMAGAAAEGLDRRISSGLVVSSHAAAVPRGWELIVAGHPVPNEGSVRAGERALQLVREAGGIVLFLVSGGGSALLESPAPGLTLDDLAAVTAVLLRSGAPIEDVNTVRTHLSAIKGGRLAAAVPGSHLTLALSDVVGSPPHAIASGPTVAAVSAPADAIAVLRRWNVTKLAPPAVLSLLENAEPPVVSAAGDFHVIGDGALAAAAAAAHLEDAGYAAVVHSTAMTGEAAVTVRRAHEMVAPGTVGVFAGETTVTVTGDGLGGRNQEAALAVIPVLAGSGDVVLTIGTDGVDGPTDAAGAVVDGTAQSLAIAAGVDVEDALTRHDSYRALDAIGALLRTGPTGTNVGDLWLIARRR